MFELRLTEEAMIVRPMLGPAVAGDGHLLAIGQEASRILSDAEIPHMVGGGIAVWAYGRRRYTKDMDLFLSAGKQIAALDALARRGFHTRDTDAGWLFKGIKEDVLIDLIVFTTGNIRVDEETFAHVRVREVDGFRFTLMGPEDLLFRKIHSTVEDRFHDWYDGLSILANPSLDFDWAYFMRRTMSRGLDRTLSFLFYAKGDLGANVVPDGVLRDLLTAWASRSNSKTT